MHGRCFATWADTCCHLLSSPLRIPGSIGYIRRIYASEAITVDYSIQIPIPIDWSDSQAEKCHQDFRPLSNLLLQLTAHNNQCTLFKTTCIYSRLFSREFRDVTRFFAGVHCSLQLHKKHDSIPLWPKVLFDVDSSVVPTCLSVIGVYALTTSYTTQSHNVACQCCFKHPSRRDG